MKARIVVLGEGDCDAEIAKEDGAVIVDEQVCRFNVTMNKAVRVQIAIV